MKKPIALLVGLLLSAATLPTYSALAADAPAAAAHEDGIDWFAGDVDAAFAYAKEHNKPLFLYWGAVWCPPCNQVKATVFNRQGFIERSRFFVPVHIDGDSPGAQKLGARFKVRGYPTTILFRPDGSEITRLPGEVDAQRYVQVLEIGMNAGRPIKETLDLALSGKGKLSADEWRLLSFYSWDTDEQQLLPAAQLSGVLSQLASLAPAGEAARRLHLSSLVARAASDPASAKVNDLDAIKFLESVVKDAKASHDNMDILTNVSAEIVNLVTVPGSDQRKQLIALWTAASKKLSLDMTLSKADRVQAVAAEVALAELSAADGKLSADLIKEVKLRAAQADKETTNAYERQSVINNVAHLLSDAGLLDDSDTLLKAELKRSHSPYYFMSSLGSNAKKRGDTVTALNWYEQAYDASKGPATRLQWGAAYLNNLLDLAPDDEARISKASTSIISELSATENAFYERNRATLEKLGKKIAIWNTLGKHQSVYTNVHQQLEGICNKLDAHDPQQAVCKGILESSQS